MIEYLTWETFNKWLIFLRIEIRQKMTHSGSNRFDDIKKYIPLTNKMTRKHIGFEFSYSENGKPICSNGSRTFPEPPVVKEHVIKLNILNQKKFTYFLFKYGIKINFVDKDRIYM
jgi:hypothetical protein